MGRKSKSDRGSSSSRPKASPPRPSRSPPQQRGPGPKGSSPSSPNIIPRTPSSPTRQGPPTPSPRPRRRQPTSTASSPSRRGPPSTPSSSSRRGTPPTHSSSSSSPRGGAPPPPPSSSPRRGAPAPSPSSSPRRVAPAPSPSSSLRRGAPASSPSSSPRRGTPASSPSSSPRRGHALTRPSSLSASTSEVTPIFDIFLDDAQDSLRKAFDGIRELFTSILKNDDLVQGKLVTKIWGCFMIRMFSSANAMEDPVYALYRTHDLYLDSVWSNQKWYRFKDHQAMLPPEIESEGSVTLNFRSSYGGLDCNPDEAAQIVVGNSRANTFYETLRQLAVKHISSKTDVKSALVLLVLFAEALRFPAFEKWLLNQIARKEDLYIPIKYTELFKNWGKLSSAFHDGRDLFSEAKEFVKQRCKTYDDVCSLLGIVNQENWRKKTKATKNQKKKKRKNREETQEAESSTGNKRSSSINFSD